MNFGDAVKEHKSGNDMYREIQPDLFWSKAEYRLVFTMEDTKLLVNTAIPFNLTDTTATDWAIVEDKKVFNLSDEVVNWNDHKGYYEGDIQQFITEIENTVFKDVETGLDYRCMIDAMKRIAGERFK